MLFLLDNENEMCSDTGNVLITESSSNKRYQHEKYLEICPAVLKLSVTPVIRDFVMHLLISIKFLSGR